MEEQIKRISGEIALMILQDMKKGIESEEEPFEFVGEDPYLFCLCYNIMHAMAKLAGIIDPVSDSLYRLNDPRSGTDQ